jgi:hypothetical protein
MAAASLSKQNRSRSGRTRKRGKRVKATSNLPNAAVAVTIQATKRMMGMKSHGVRSDESGMLPTINALTPPPGPHSGSRLLRHSRSITPPTRLDIDHAQAHANGDNSPSPVDDEHPCVSRLSRSPSATGNSDLAAEYQEWPFQGFLKCVRVGNETTYNLEFKLPCMSECSGLPISDNTFSSISLQASATPRRRRKTSSHSKPRAAVLSTLTKRVPWKPEEDTKLLDEE